MSTVAHRFCRYADDCNIYVKSERAGQRVMQSVRRYVEEFLKLKLNEQKSAVDRPRNRKFLGFRFTGLDKIRIGIAPQSMDRYKARIREITDRSSGDNIEWRIRELNTFLRGWFGYFSLALMSKRYYNDMDGWIRRRKAL